MYTLKIVTKGLNEVGDAIKRWEYKREARQLHVVTADNESNVVDLQPGDTAYLVNSNNRTVATYTNSALHDNPTLGITA
ncbi:hypothetical protein ABQ345_09515 [Serratia fonticola]|uniref:hypothetical protein n=1 Tax=Serratia fonticola TaxID=47917 RepID=UPI003AADE5F0